MVEIRPFDGAPEEMASFLRRVWVDAGEARVLTPVWSREYLNWQFFDNPHAERDYMLAAYDRGRMVGALLAVDGRFRAGDHIFRGSWGSWLTVDPEYRIQFIAPQLVAAMCERHVAHGSRLIMGYGYPAGAGMSIEFWQAFARAWPKVVLRKMMSCRAEKESRIRLSMRSTSGLKSRPSPSSSTLTT